MQQDVLANRSGSILTLTLNRPHRLNSFDRNMLASLCDRLEEAAEAPDVRCLVLTGTGSAFSTGQDLNERVPILEGEKIDLGDALENGFNRVVRLIRKLPVPVVCAVNGITAGAGTNLALACDIVLAARSAAFRQSFVSIGLIPDTGGTWFLPRRVGSARAAALAMLSEPVSADEAEQLGLIWKCVSDDELQSATLEIAGRLARTSPTALALLKRALDAATTNSLDAQLDLERDLQREAGYTEDYRKGVADFMEKRSRAIIS